MEIINPIVISLPGDKKKPKPAADTMCATDALAPPHTWEGGCKTNCPIFRDCPHKGRG